ncbi:MAG: DMT family transporter [Methanobacteriota archaeon]
MDSQLLGNGAAIIVSMLWTACSIFFSSAGKRIGALSVNTIRITAAVGLLLTAHVILMGALLPSATDGQWFYLGLSGIVGLAIGDIGYIGALVLIGPRRGVLLMSTAPIFAALAAYAMLGEALGAWALAGIAVTMSGVMLAVLDEKDPGEVQQIPRDKLALGYGLAVMGSVCQGVGLVLSKYGMQGADGAEPIDPLSATLMRMLVGAASMWTVVIVLRRLGEIRKATKDGGAIGRTLAGTVTGPFLGVWLSMVAISYTLTGVAQTLMSLMPIMVIPVVWIVYRQRTGWRGVVGAAVAIVGVAMLFLV